MVAQGRNRTARTLFYKPGSTTELLCQLAAYGGQSGDFRCAANAYHSILAPVRLRAKPPTQGIRVFLLSQCVSDSYLQSHSPLGI